MTGLQNSVMLSPRFLKNCMKVLRTGKRPKGFLKQTALRITEKSLQKELDEIKNSEMWKRCCCAFVEAGKQKVNELIANKLRSNLF